jgi:DNA-binding transcriptional LysR family regulator
LRRAADEAVKGADLDRAIVRKEAADDSLSALPCGLLAYGLVVPRKLLPSTTAAGIQLLRKIPLALLSGDGVLAKGVMALAAKLNVELDVGLKAGSTGLLASAIENADLAAVTPRSAVNELSKERFASIKIDEPESLTRELALVMRPKRPCFEKTSVDWPQEYPRCSEVELSVSATIGRDVGTAR